MKRNILKKLLGLLGTISLIVPTTILTVSCSTNTKKINITTVIKKKSLVIINKSTEYEIRQALLLNNPKLVTSDFEITNINTSESSGTASLIGQDKYNGKVIVSFYIVQALEDNLINTDLGTISSKTESTIRNAILSKNPDINTNGFEITEIDSTSALIIGDDFIYNGSVTVVFTIQARKPSLSSLITKKDLGILPDNNSLTIQQAIIKLNPKLTSKDISITSINQTSARVNSTSSGRYTGSVNVTFNIDGTKPEKTNLENVITNKNITTVLPNADPDVILNALVKVNPKLNSNYVRIYDAGFNSSSGWGWARVTSTDENIYINPKQGYLDLTFIVDENLLATDLASVITNTNLGTLDKLDETTIKNQLVKSNPNLEVNYVDINNITQTSATVTSNNPSKYKGSVNITFKLDTSKAIPLSSALKETSLGTLTSTDEDTIKQAIKLKNSSIDINAIGIDSQSITTSNALVISTDQQNIVIQLK